MPALYWNLDTNLVTAQAFDQSALAFEDTRGSVALRVICTRGDVNSGTQVLLGADQIVGIVLRDPGNLKGAGYLAGPTTFTRGAAPADGYIATASTDTTVVRTIMHVDGTEDELPEYPASAVLYSEPTSGGDALESLPFSWTILPRYYEPGTPPADIVAVWSSPAQLQAAIAAAAAAQPKLPTPTANGQFLFGNTDGSVHFGAFPTGLSLSLAALTVSATATFGDQVSVFALGITGNTAGIDEGGNITGDGAGITNLNPSNLSAPVPIAQGGTGATTAAGALTALGASPVASPTFTGVVTIPAGASIAGFAPLASPTFTGTVTIPAGASIAGFAPLASPTFTGTVTIPAGASIAGFAPLASPTFTGTVTAPAFVGSGAGLTNVAPFHPVSYGLGGPMGNGTTIAYGANTMAWNPSGTTTARISDVSGTVRFQTTGNILEGDVVATITFNNSYGLQSALNNAAIPIVVQSALAGSVPATGQTAVFAAFAGVMASNGNTMQIVCGASDAETTAHVSIPSGENFVVSYFIAVA